MDPEIKQRKRPLADGLTSGEGVQLDPLPSALEVSLEALLPASILRETNVSVT
jgi:hypothetical protein